MIKRNKIFIQKFGDIGYLEPGGGLVSAPNDRKGTFFFPESMSEEQVEELIDLCVKENKYLIFDLVKNNRVVYKPGCLY